MALLLPYLPGSSWWRVAWLLAGLLALLPAPAARAATPPDSLLRALRTAATDTEQVKTALRLSAALAGTDSTRATRYARQALALSRRARYPYGTAFGWLQLGTLAIIRHDNAAAARYATRAATLADSLYRRTPGSRLRRLQALIANNRGTVADNLGQYAAATTYYLRAADLLAGLGDRRALLTVYGNLGNDFQHLRQPAAAARYWRLAVALGAGPPPAPELLLVYLRLAGLHLLQRHPDSARLVLQAARPLAGPANLYTGEYYGKLAEYYLAANNLPAARAAFAQAQPYLQRKGAAGYQVQLLQGLGQLAWQAGQPAAARAQLLQALAFTRQLGDLPQQAVTLAALARLEAGQRQYQAALLYTQQSQRLRDSLTSAATTRQINQLETRFRTRQQTQQLAEARRTEATQRLALRQQRQLNAAYLLLLALLLAAGALAVLWLRYRQRQARHARAQHEALLTTQAVLQGQDEERRRVARDLHDGLGGMLATVKLYLSSVRTRGGLPPESAPVLQQSIDHLDHSVAELRRVARNLMPEALLSFGLDPALHDLCQAVGQGSPLDVQLTTHGLLPRLPAATEVELYRLVQELLTNALRHAQARQVLVQVMRHGPELHLVVEDDGQGFDATTARPGVGLRSVQARAQYLGGQLDVQSQPGQGTSVSLTLTVPNGSSADFQSANETA